MPYCRKLTANIEGLIQQRPEDVRVVVYFPMHTDCNSGTQEDSTHGLFAKRLTVHEQQNSGRTTSCSTFCQTIIPISSNMPTSGLNKDTFVSCEKLKLQAK